MYHTGGKPAFSQLFQLFPVISHPAAGAAKGKRWTNNNRKPHIVRRLKYLIHALGKTAAWNPQADALHCMAELFTIFRLVNHIERSAYHLHAITFQYAVFRDRHRGIEAGLSSKGGKQGIGPFSLDNFGHRLRCNRLNICPVGNIRIRHNRCRIAVDKHNLIALFFQSLAGLGSGVVKLAGLTNDNRP